MALFFSALHFLTLSGSETRADSHWCPDLILASLVIPTTTADAPQQLPRSQDSRTSRNAELQACVSKGPLLQQDVVWLHRATRTMAVFRIQVKLWSAHKNYFTSVKDPWNTFQSLLDTRKWFSLLSRTKCFLGTNLYYERATWMLLVTDISYWVFIY